MSFILVIKNVDNRIIAIKYNADFIKSDVYPYLVLIAHYVCVEKIEFFLSCM